MHNQHAELSQLLADQRITQGHEQATHCTTDQQRSPTASSAPVPGGP